MGFVIDPKILPLVKARRARLAREQDETLPPCARFGHRWVYDREFDGREACAVCGKFRRDR